MTAGPEASAARPASNAERIIAILSCFGADNAARPVQDLVSAAATGRSTAFGLVQAMTRAGLLRRTGHGTLKLGPAAQRLAFQAAGGLHTDLTEPRHYVAPAGAPGRRISGEIADLHPDLLRLVASPRGKRPGPWRIGVANASLSNPWRVGFLNAMRYAARLHAQEIADFRIETAEDDPDRQMEQISAMMADGIDALLVSAAPDPDGRLDAFLTEEVAPRIDVVAVDRRPSSPSGWLTFVTASDDTIGRTSATWLAEYLGGTGRIWMLSGLADSSPAIRRRSAALSALEDHPGIEIAALRDTGWTTAGGYNAAQDLLAETGPPDGVWSDSGLQGVGALRYLTEAGVSLPPHTGGDINGMYKSALNARIPLAALDYPAAMGARAVDAALDLLEGRAVPRRIETPVPTVLTRGAETRSVKADIWAEEHVRWDLPDTTVLSQGKSLRDMAVEDAA